MEENDDDSWYHRICDITRIRIFYDYCIAGKDCTPLCGVAWSMVLVNSFPMAVDMAPQDRLGAYTGLYYLSSQTSAIVGPVLSGKIIDIFNNDYRIAFMYGAVTLVIALLFVFPIKRGEALTA